MKAANFSRDTLSEPPAASSNNCSIVLPWPLRCLCNAATDSVSLASISARAFFSARSKACCAVVKMRSALDCARSRRFASRLISRLPKPCGSSMVAESASAFCSFSWTVLRSSSWVEISVFTAPAATFVSSAGISLDSEDNGSTSRPARTTFSSMVPRRLSASSMTCNTASLCSSMNFLLASCSARLTRACASNLTSATF
mmetsp:Transcript_48853/g.142385  ORF Transcript_48853/g.142385 Transcript_48853/m.142385 type:complete len:200 (-) Transcript_48853:1058-1657(-)